MNKALVIHPDFTVYGGGEFLCLNVCSILQKRGYSVDLVSNAFKPSDIDEMYGPLWGNVMRNCLFNPIPKFEYPKFRKLTASSRIFYARKIRNMFKEEEYDVVFSTQSSVFDPIGPQFHFIYHPADIFAFPGFGKMPTGTGSKFGSILSKLGKIMVPDNPSPDHFFGLSTKITSDLHELGYENSSFLFPPCEMPFRPRKKIHRVVQATRITPQKRLEVFCEAAFNLPEYEFVLIGRDSEEQKKFNPGYSDKLKTIMESIPNITYIESPVRKVANIIEESKVYLYTGEEPGIGITQMEAVGAGCIPICSKNSGGSDVVQFSGYGSTFSSMKQLIDEIRKNMDLQYFPEDIAKSAKIFSPKLFEEEILKWSNI